MAPQTSYPSANDLGLEGMIADLAQRTVDSLTNEESSAVPFGRGVIAGTDDDQFKLPSGAANVMRGITVHSQATEDPTDDGIASEETAGVMVEGRIIVTPETTIAIGDPVFLRWTAGAAGEVAGRFRNDADGVAQVTTVTPGTANTTLFTINVFAGGKLFSYFMTTDGSGTPTEVVTAIKALMAADAVFTALVVATGTATLILTADAEDVPFQATDGGSPGAMVVVATTAASGEAIDVSAFCQWKSTGAAIDDPVVLEIRKP